MSAEGPSSSRTTRASPQHQANGHDDRTPPPSRTEEKRGSMRQNHPEHPSSGPASLASAFASSYCGSGGVTSESNGGQALPGGRSCSSREQGGRGCGSDSVGRKRPSSKHLFNITCEFADSPSYPSPVQCNMAERGLVPRERRCSSPPAAPQPCSDAAAPALDSCSYSEQNGRSSLNSRASALPARSSRLQNLPKGRPRSDNDPNQGAPSRGQEHCPALSRAERMAALERRMLANGLSAPGRSRSSPGQKRRAHAGGPPHMGGVQMNDCGTTSGSESSESEAEWNRSSSLQPSGHPVETSFASSIPRSKFSFGSLQLDEEADEEGCWGFSDEDGGQVFNC